MKTKPIRSFIKGTDFPDSTDTGSIEIIGNEKVIIEHAESIMEYENERVRVSTGKLTVAVTGMALTLDSYSEKIIIISGFIKSLSFE